MSRFDDLVKTATKQGESGPTIHGIMGKIVDGNGKVLHSTLEGHVSIDPSASPLDENATLKFASGTKLVTTVALLQCVEQGKIGLDGDLSKVVPEFRCNWPSKILEGFSEMGEPKLTTVTTPITARHLLTHTSGLGYRFLHPLLLEWSKTPNFKRSNFVTECYDTPLVFEPGTAWEYGCSLDWAGVVIRRLHDTPLEEYLIKNVWKRVGRKAPFPTFHLSRFPEYKARLMHIYERLPGGGLQETDKLPVGDNPDDEEGGNGLICTMNDYLAVLSDLVSDKPSLLKKETIDMMYQPQLESGSPAVDMLLAMRPVWGIMAGPVKDQDVNHGLGALLLRNEVPEIGQPSNILCWGGAANMVWFMSRDKGVVGFLSTQLTPFPDAKMTEIVNAWKKDFWDNFKI